MSVTPGPGWLNRAQPYAVTILLAGGAAALWLVGGTPYGLGAAALAVGSFAITRRLTGRVKLLDQRARDLEQELYRSRQLSKVDELSGGIAHEINNPLGIIAQEAEWIHHLLRSNSLKDIKETEECADSLREIVRQVDRCKEIVHKLLNLAREMQPVIQLVDITDLIENLTGLVERVSKPNKNITVVRQFDGNLPLVYTDPPLLRQVILNLLVNATQAIDKEGTVTVVTQGLGDSVEIRVEDTGCGIPPEQLKKLFTPFFSTKRQGEGTGLGLAICRGIIERLGGSISVTSDVGRCTAFTIDLPVGKGAG